MPGKRQPATAVAARLQQAVAHQQMGQLARAELLYREILAQVPGQFDALHLLGVLQYQKGEHEEAANLIRQAIVAEPRHAAAHSNLGLALRKIGKLEAAVASCDRALQLRPDYSAALYNRGLALRDLKRPEEALASFERALALKPRDAAMLNDRGNALVELNRHEDALASYDFALALKPDFADALNNRGIALLYLKRHEDALASYDRALALEPASSPAFHNSGIALRELTRYAEAAAFFERLVALAPDYEYAIGNLLNCQLHCCEWAAYAQRTKQITDAVEAGRKAAVPFVFLAASDSAPAQLKCARAYVADKHPASSSPMWTGQCYVRDRIRVAYLSADFHDHATAYLMAGLFEVHDKRRFEITAVSYGPDVRGGMRERLHRSFDHFADVRGSSDREVAQMLHASEIDIAVDLKGFTTDCRPGILSHRAAPVQVNYLGYPGTMGADYIDYIVADSHVIPPEHDAFYSEKVVRLPDSYQVNDSTRRIAELAPSRSELGLPEKGFVFCCFNNSYKIAPDVFDVWMRLLNEVPSSVLWLLDDNATASRNLCREAQRRGVAAERLVFAPRMTMAEHLARHRVADLFLDTLPINAHTTASDALWAGLPVLTCIGTAFAGRVAASLLNAVGLPELIAKDLDGYGASALRLATTPALLSAIRVRLVENRATCALFDTDRFRRHIESAYITMWERYQRGERPQGFAVPPIALR